MEVKELRLGNWVSNKHGIPMIVKAVYEDTVYVDFKGNVGGLWEFNKYEPFTPIPLTEEILLKCGFNKNEIGGYIMYTELGSMLCVYKDGSFRSNGRYIDAKIKYLHQLQNLYFALTNQELEVEL